MYTMLCGCVYLFDWLLLLACCLFALTCAFWLLACGGFVAACGLSMLNLFAFRCCFAAWL